MAVAKVTTRTVSWDALVRQALGPEFNKPDVAYKFNNGRKFDSTDKGTSGVYRRT